MDSSELEKGFKNYRDPQETITIQIQTIREPSNTVKVERTEQNSESH